MFTKSLSAFAILAFASTTAAAQEAGDISVGLGVTNFGLSLEGEYTINTDIAVRGMLMGGFSFEGDFDFDDTPVDGEASLGGVALMVDYYPLSNPLRISGGVFFSSSKVSGEFTNEISPGNIETYNGEIGLKRELAPMIAVGFKTDVATGWAVSGDLGLILSSLEATSDVEDGSSRADIEELNDALEDVPVFPFIGLSVSYSY